MLSTQAAQGRAPAPMLLEGDINGVQRPERGGCLFCVWLLSLPALCSGLLPHNKTQTKLLLGLLGVWKFGTSRFGVYSVSLEGSQDVGVINTGGKWRQVEKHRRKWSLLAGSEPSGALPAFRRGSGEPSQVQSIRTINRALKQLAGWGKEATADPGFPEPVLEPHRNFSNPSLLCFSRVCFVCVMCAQAHSKRKKSDA